MKNSRNNHTINKSRNRKVAQERRRIAFKVLVLSLAFLTLFLLHDLYVYKTDSKIDPNDPYPVMGVDVSSYQKDIDWVGLESEGVEFAFIKATEGSKHIDGRFEYNWEEAHKTRMKVGAYHFLSFDSKGSSQVSNFTKTVNRKWGMLPPVVDVELYGDYLDTPPKAQKVQKILDEVLQGLEKKYHKKPIIYTNTYVYELYISKEYKDYSIWLSNPDIPKKLPDGKRWTFCQYTFEGISKYVANGEKYVDFNVFYGSKWDFKKYKGR
ncbi:MAG: glycoside hydrolase family 25 [Clostridiales bacterium]|nr:glycoside hydrolase family 25 [Clostridiales bacterium]